MTKKMILFFTFFLSINLFSSIEDHLKKAENKQLHHSMPGIDFIYMINLDQRPEKFQLSLNQLKPFGIVPYRFSAVNGWELSLEQIKDVSLKYESWMSKHIKGTRYLDPISWEPTDSFIDTPGETYLGHCASRGVVGIVLSHLSILKDALDSGYETIWVMEDDIEVIENPMILSELINELDQATDKKWDIFFTDPDTRDQNGNFILSRASVQRPDFLPKNPQKFTICQSINQNFNLIGARYGAYSMILRRSGIQKIYDFLLKHKVFLPYDIEICLLDDIIMYASKKPIIASLIRALSDNGTPTYKK